MNNRSDGINNLRFLSSFAVLLTHFGIPNDNLDFIMSYYHNIAKKLLWSNQGLHFGVVIFVAMSGFLIHSTSKNEDWKIYLIKRFVRIYPLFLIASLTGFVIHSFNDLKSLLLNLFLISSVVPNQGPPGNVILITVVVEMVIYILYIYLRRFQTHKVLLALSVIYAINIYIYHKLGVAGEYIERNLFSLIFFWWIGAASQEYFFSLKIKIKPVNLLIVYIAYLLVSNLIYFRGLHYFYSALLAVIASFVISHIYNNNSFRFNKQTCFSLIINKLGESAYSIYAWHIIILFTFKKFTSFSSFYYFISIFLTLTLSLISNLFIEKYFNNKRWVLISKFKKLS